LILNLSLLPKSERFNSAIRIFIKLLHKFASKNIFSWNGFGYFGYTRKVGQDFRIFRIYKINILKTKNFFLKE